MPVKHQVTADPEWARLPSLRKIFPRAFDLRLCDRVSRPSKIRQQNRKKAGQVTHKTDIPCQVDTHTVDEKKARARQRTKEWKQNNRELVHSQKARRRSRDRAFAMTRDDRKESAEYRKSIADDPCFYCGNRTEVMHVDHDIPLARGGSDHWWNLVRACSDCNLRKNDKTGAEFLRCTGGAA